MLRQKKMAKEFWKLIVVQTIVELNRVRGSWGQRVRNMTPWAIAGNLHEVAGGLRGLWPVGVQAGLCICGRKTSTCLVREVSKCILY